MIPSGQDIQACRIYDPQSETIMYYKIRFNFTFNEVIEYSDPRPVVVYDASIVYMKKGTVKNYEQHEMVQIMGCSRYQTSIAQIKQLLNIHTIFLQMTVILGRVLHAIISLLLRS